MSWKNISDKFRFGLKGLPPGSIYIGDKKLGTWQGRTLVNFRRDNDAAEWNGMTMFGANATILRDEYNNDRYYWECLDPLYMPIDNVFDIHLLGGNTMRIDSQSGGSMEGSYLGGAFWNRYVQDGKTHTGIVVCTCETDYKKSGKIAWVTWSYPSTGLYAAGTWIHWYVRTEIASLAPTLLQRIFAVVKPKEIEIPFEKGE